MATARAGARRACLDHRCAPEQAQAWVLASRSLQEGQARNLQGEDPLLLRPLGHDLGLERRGRPDLRRKGRHERVHRPLRQRLAVHRPVPPDLVQAEAEGDDRLRPPVRRSRGSEADPHRRRLHPPLLVRGRRRRRSRESHPASRFRAHRPSLRAAAGRPDPRRRRPLISRQQGQPRGVLRLHRGHRARPVRVHLPHQRRREQPRDHRRLADRRRLGSAHDLGGADGATLARAAAPLEPAGHATHRSAKSPPRVASGAVPTWPRSVGSSASARPPPTRAW